MTRFSSKLPIWYQLAQTLRTRILNGKLVPGQRIESEVRLAACYGISVLPVRQALRALEEEGLIVRRRGSGTYVADPLPTSNPAATSLETLYSREFTRPARVLALGEVNTPTQFTGHFPDDERLSFIRRLAFRDDLPWSYGTLYYPRKFADKLTAERLARYPTYRLLREFYGLKLTHSHFEARAIAADGDTATHLGIEPFSAALALSCVTFEDTGAAVGAFEMTFRGDPFVFSFETSHELG